MIRATSLFVVVLALWMDTAAAFCSAPKPVSIVRTSSVSFNPTGTSPSSTALAERRWNFNDGQSPWGMKKNAETWNGRVAQVRLGFDTGSMLMMMYVHTY